MTQKFRRFQEILKNLEMYLEMYSLSFSDAIWFNYENSVNFLNAFFVTKPFAVLKWHFRRWLKMAVPRDPQIDFPGENVTIKRDRHLARELELEV